MDHLTEVALFKRATKVREQPPRRLILQICHLMRGLDGRLVLGLVGGVDLGAGVFLLLQGRGVRRAHPRQAVVLAEDRYSTSPRHWRLPMIDRFVFRSLSALTAGLAIALPALSEPYADEARDYGVSSTKSIKGAPYNVSTPLQIPGARTLTTDELKQMLAQDPKPIVIDALGRPEMIESAVGMGTGIGEQRMFGKDRTAFPKALERLTAGDKGRPLIFYCLSSMCWHSYNASLRALEEGYTQVMWYRGGLDAWKASNGPTVPFRQAIEWQ